ncbi:hypothetical protein [Hyalangium gracile]|uniref:hypothetical protein n=1 Tax=Hyalangium gracile TaxID=394092 RepID=UPI001CCACC28|nr:hypothetical protein [Hyalangium gracile]
MNKAFRYINQFLTVLGIVCFFVFLAWSLPYMAVAIFLRLRDLVSMIRTHQPVPNVIELALLIPPSLAVWYVFSSQWLGRFFGRIPVVRPAILMVYVLFVGTTWAANQMQRGLRMDTSGYASLLTFAIVILVGTRIVMSVLFTLMPATTIARPGNRGTGR